MLSREGLGEGWAGGGIVAVAADVGVDRPEDVPGEPAEVGTASILWAVTLPDDGPTGELRRDGQPLPW
jgi:hypothetical protein